LFLPYGEIEQDDFLNGCLELKTLLTPKELLIVLQEIERQAKRERIIKWGPRTLDLDIIFYDDLIISEEELVIPHIEMHKRDFVLRPLAQIAPYKRNPVNLKMVLEMLGDL
jgi:dihydroneopterin aldolase/2-amino-4-hydroxy-6-hydroxymethyldihydropteridine diphosphokinase